MIKPKIVLLIFVSGKIVLTGAKVREEIYTAFESIYPVLNGMTHLDFFVAISPLLTMIKISARFNLPGLLDEIYLLSHHLYY